MTQLFKRHLPDILVVLAFVVIAFAYFFPADTEGRILYRHDSSAGRGAGMEVSNYREKTGGGVPLDKLRVLRNAYLSVCAFL